MSRSGSAYIYDPATLVLDKETITYGNGLSRTLDRAQDNLVRPAGFELKNGSNVTLATSYGYDNIGRLAGVHSGSTYPANPDFSYNYLANSGSLVQSVTGPAHTVTNTYEATRNVLNVKTNTAGSVVSAFDYTVNALGQRNDVARSGSAFTSANTETWSYNAKGEVVSADHSSNDAFDRVYQFDSIGNRIQAADGLDLAAPSAISYTANSLNQYSTVGATARSFDDDGNLIDDGTKQYLWDAENRLLSVKQGATTLAEFAYDYQSRRISKTANGSNVTFVYDEWNPIAEYVDGTLAKTYTWGMDLSGTMQGAGGVGGLLSVNEGSATYYPTYDGNGNISEYLDASGAVVAHYEYDAFGRTVVQSGAKANDFSHQFSTKQRDAETGLHYYGYRYYDPQTGRWPSRDPIEEFGGLNIYAFIGNEAVSQIDLLGLADGEKVEDDFRRKCCKDEMQTISYQYEPTDLLNDEIGHAQLCTPNLGQVGFGPDEGMFGGKGMFFGKDLPDSYDLDACPDSVAEAERRIKESKDSEPEYNVFTNNCAHWAKGILDDSGLNRIEKLKRLFGGW